MNEPVVDLSLKTPVTADALVRAYGAMGGFGAPKVSAAVDVLEAMQKDKGCVKFLTVTANVLSTGLRGVVRDLVKHKMVDVVVTTAGAIDHDLIRLWSTYRAGSFDVDDKELADKGVFRLGSVFIDRDDYGPTLEKHLQPILKELQKEGLKEFGTHQLYKAIGLKIAKEKKAEESILYWAAKNDVKILVPGPTDGASGHQVWEFAQDHKEFRYDLFQDMKFLHILGVEAQRAGALIVGGGISKHHVIGWAHFRDGLDYAVQVTTAPEHDGSLSGARTREAVSWHKIKTAAPHVTVEGDATVLLPLMYAALQERLSK